MNGSRSSEEKVRPEAECLEVAILVSAAYGIVRCGKSVSRAIGGDDCSGRTSIDGATDRAVPAAIALQACMRSRCECRPAREPANLGLDFDLAERGTGFAVDRRGHSIVAHLHDVVQPRGTISVVATAEDEAPRSPRGRALLRRRAGKRAAARPTSRSRRPTSRPMPLYAAACGPNRRSRRSRVSRFVAVSFIEDPSMVRPSDSNAKSFDTSNFDPSSRARPAAGIISGTHGRPLPVSVSNDASMR